MARRRSPWILYILHLLIHYCTAYTALTDETLKAIPSPGNDFHIQTGSILAPILIPRVAGTEGSTKVRNHLVTFFRKNLPHWEITFQNSTSQTPATGVQEIPFVNIIASRDPPLTKEKAGEVGRLTLAAHYDSKLTPKDFIGATDSAAPCAMLLHLARSIDAALTKKWATIEAEEGVGSGGGGSLSREEHKGVQILLLDGEEAFVSWTATDSIYGARSLAAEWAATSYPVLSTYRNPLAAIELFVLLDLLGAKQPTVPSYFKTTHWAYKNLAVLEERLRSLNLFESSPNHPNQKKKKQKTKRKQEKKRSSSAQRNNPAKSPPSNPSQKQSSKRQQEPFFLTDRARNPDQPWLGGWVLDDHVPFMDRGVAVLHLIPTPFPAVWHEMTDDGAHLDLATVADWTTLVTAFTAEWMDLEGFWEGEGEHHGDGTGKGHVPRSEL